MNAMNKFSVTGFICKDAEVKNFEKAAIARFGIIIKHAERRGNETVIVSSILSLETWVKNEDTATLELLKKGKEGQEGKMRTGGHQGRQERYGS